MISSNKNWWFKNGDHGSVFRRGKKGPCKTTRIAKYQIENIKFGQMKVFGLAVSKTATADRQFFLINFISLVSCWFEKVQNYTTFYKSFDMILM